MRNCVSWPHFCKQKLKTKHSFSQLKSPALLRFVSYFAWREKKPCTAEKAQLILRPVMKETTVGYSMLRNRPYLRIFYYSMAKRVKVGAWWLSSVASRSKSMSEKFNSACDCGIKAGKLAAGRSPPLPSYPKSCWKLKTIPKTLQKYRLQL